MTVTSIQRDLNSNVCFVRMISTDNLATISQPNYIANNQAVINALNGGTFGWFMSDMLLVAASDGNALFQFTDDTFTSLIIYGEQGSGTINPGLTNELAYYPANGTNISGLGTANNGVLVTSNSGVPSISTIIPSATQLNITSVGTLTVGVWNATPVTVPFGGTGDTTFTAYGVICGGTTATDALQSVVDLGSIGDLLTSNGPGALPTFQTGIASGIITTGALNDLAYYSSNPTGKTLSAITTADNGVLITSGLGVPSISSTLPSAVQLNITSVGTLTAGTWNASAIGSTYGGTGLSNPTAHGIMVAEGSSAMTPITLSSGQLLIGSTGADPVAAAINSGTGILVGNGAGSITVSLNAIADQRILSNISGGSAAPIPNTLTAIIDECIGSTQGDILYRSATAWSVLAPSTSGYVLTTGGAAANPAWAPTTAPSAAALTESNDTNVTLTLGGTPATALLQAVSITAGWAGTLSLARGGAGASLTASNGGIVYSTASALAILAGTATAGLALLSGASTTPSWSSSPPITRVVKQSFVATGTYTPTTGMKYCIIEMVGGGGGGGAETSSVTRCDTSGGGGAGSYSRSIVTAATIGASQTVTIGALGAGGTSGGNGGNGGTTSVGSIITAPGGSGGIGGTNAGTLGGLGGVAGTADLAIPGQAGGGGVYNGAVVIGTLPGQGGSSIFGAGGIQGVSATAANGNAGLGYGAGGSGANGYNSATAFSGGAGTAGIVFITEYVSI